MTDLDATITARQVDLDGEIAHELDTEAALGTRTAHGVAWVAGARLGGQVVQFASSIVLARLLLPSAYGLVAIVWTFTGFAGLFTDLGLGSALVQSRRLTETDATTGFAINALAGVLLTLFIIALRVPMANLFGQPQVAGLLALASLMFTLSMTIVPTALMERRMQFGRVAALDIATTTVGLIVSVVCAATGLGAVSLVIGPLVGVALSTIGSFIASGWYPRAWPSRASARRLLSFGSHLTGFNIVNYWARNGDNLLLGKFAGTVELGFYNRAYTLMLMPINQVSGVLGRVLLPVFSALQHDPERLRAAILRVCRTSAVLVFPLLFGLAGVAPHFVLVAFGPHWRGVTPLLIILALSGPPQVVTATSGLVCQAVGQTRVLSTWGNLSSLTVIVAVLIGLPWGAEGVSIAFAARAYLMLPLALVPLKRAVGIGAGPMLRASAFPFIAAALMAASVAVMGVVLSPPLPMGACLAVQVLGGIAVYVGYVGASDPSAFAEVRRVVLRRGG